MPIGVPIMPPAGLAIEAGAAPPPQIDALLCSRAMAAILTLAGAAGLVPAPIPCEFVPVVNPAKEKRSSKFVLFAGLAATGVAAVMGVFIGFPKLAMAPGR